MVGRAATIRLERISPGMSGQVSTKDTYSGIGYSSILHRDVKVNANEDALGLEINVGNGEFVRERHGLVIRPIITIMLLFIFPRAQSPVTQPAFPLAIRLSRVLRHRIRNRISALVLLS
jgi:hypothetical protein